MEWGHCRAVKPLCIRAVVQGEGLSSAAYTRVCDTIVAYAPDPGTLDQTEFAAYEEVPTLVLPRGAAGRRLRNVALGRFPLAHRGNER
jgi:hypothetical protein